MVRKIRLIDYDLLTRFASRRNQQQHYSISVSAVFRENDTIPESLLDCVFNDSGN